MSISTKSDVWVEWCVRHGVHRRKSVTMGPKSGVCPCRLGQTARKECRCRRTWGSWATGWADHTETFFRDRRPAIITSEPYDLPNPKLIAGELENLGAVAFLHPTEESRYFPGRSHLIVIVRLDEADEYQRLEPTAVRWAE